MDLLGVPVEATGRRVDVSNSCVELTGLPVVVTGRRVDVSNNRVELTWLPVDDRGGGGITRKMCPLPPSPVEDLSPVTVGRGPSGSNWGWKWAVVVGRMVAVLIPPFAAKAEGATDIAATMAAHPNKRDVDFISNSPDFMVFSPTSILNQ